jgi:hypothetical protein
MPVRIDRRRCLILVGGAALALGSALGAHRTVSAAPAGCALPPRDPAPFAAPDPSVGWSAPPGPTPTTIRASRHGYIYKVAGRPETIRGMGYNPVVDGLTPEQRQTRLARDLSLMAEAGVNTLIGWNPSAIDGLALDVAHQAGIGVALPFDVDVTLDVRDPSVQQTFTSAVLAWVTQYKEHPALRIWAIGNDVLQRSVPPDWCSALASDEQAGWSAAWCDLLLETADAVHAIDPLHPVLYREADDAYAPWLARAMDRRPAERRWLIYGMNVYHPRLATVLGRWPGRHVPTPVLVSEFAPLNAPRQDRTARLRELWAVIRSFRAYVLGGAVYVWSTNGPDEMDRQVGLVDANGTPVDDAFDTVATIYHADERRAATTASPAARTGQPPSSESSPAPPAPPAVPAVRLPGRSAHGNLPGIDG